jgi:hypothetical protein
MDGPNEEGTDPYYRYSRISGTYCDWNFDWIHGTECAYAARKVYDVLQIEKYDRCVEAGIFGNTNCWDWWKESNGV